MPATSANVTFPPAGLARDARRRLGRTTCRVVVNREQHREEGEPAPAGPKARLLRSGLRRWGRRRARRRDLARPAWGCANLGAYLLRSVRRLSKIDGTKQG